MQDNVVWTSTLDGKYEVTVTRTERLPWRTHHLRRRSGPPSRIRRAIVRRILRTGRGGCG